MLKAREILCLKRRKKESKRKTVGMKGNFCD